MQDKKQMDTDEMEPNIDTVEIHQYNDENI